jgi:asparagine synthase (glutamine-hydrolysing)
LVSDVPVGIFLSGGYDSSLVTALVQKNEPKPIKTFTIGFEDGNYNEAPYARAIADYLKTDHHEYICSEKDALDIIPQLAFYFDEPFGDSSAIPTMLVSQLAREHVTVALSADAGDEVFGGYNKYTQILKNLSKIPELPVEMRKLISKVNGVIPLGMAARVFGKSRHEQILPIFNEILGSKKIPDAMLQLGSKRIANQNLKKLLSFDLTHRSNAFDFGIHAGEEIVETLNRLMAIDYTTYLPDDILVKVDRAGMSVSLEGREPLLDHRIIEYVAGLPAHMKIRNGEKKYLLKRVAERHIPKELLDRPKKGFAIPVNKWMRNEINPMLRSVLDKDRLKRQGLFQYNEVDILLKRYERGENQNSELLWFIFMYQLWAEHWQIN